MKKENLEQFKKSCKEFAEPFSAIFTTNTTEKYLHTFAKFRAWRLQDELMDRYGIEFKTTDVDAYKIYEDIVVATWLQGIEEYKKKKHAEELAEKENKRKGEK